MNTEFYRKLIDLYAGHELPLALEEEMEIAAMADADLAAEMRGMRETYEVLKESPQPDFSEETCQRILMKMIAKGADVETSAPEPAHFQYQLPIQG